MRCWVIKTVADPRRWFTGEVNDGAPQTTFDRPKAKEFEDGADALEMIGQWNSGEHDHYHVVDDKSMAAEHA